ncbi:MAG TPA: hypothetical protein PKX48_08140 [Planctomycetota bacterium]|nr:hypothetical protein [Planctomycetota bacterium]OQC21147.1 MAG: hypothetical protein BWX69_01123 [Planctomycetes bacterium ADurb.Bin069]NMD36598.1 hypothetical protein [Planctomycetota bacterium]HNR99774.1 hypothetical protein [Planctomycetota bacterium]HNU26935.1 hypothetical protein [Planctomycetota bacterium]
MTDYGDRPQRPRRKAPPPRPKAPLWVLLVFIGLPSAAIVCMVGYIIYRDLQPPPPEPPPPPPDPAVLVKEADALYRNALKDRAAGRAKAQEEKDASFEFNSAIKKLQEAQQVYEGIIQKIKEDNNGVLPADYRGYENKITEIQRALVDTAKMKNY